MAGPQAPNGHQEFSGWGLGNQWLGFMKSNAACPLAQAGKLDPR